MKEKNAKIKRASKECAYVAVFAALLIAAQLCFAFLPGVEIVTVLFIAYSFVFGARRGVLSAVTFSLLRQLVFGFFPVVLILYLIYYPLLAFLFGFLGGRVKKLVRSLWWITVLACLCTVCFTMLDNLLTLLWYSSTKEAAKAYFIASLSVLLPHVLCTALTVALLFLPLERVFRLVKS